MRKFLDWIKFAAWFALFMIVLLVVWHFSVKAWNWLIASSWDTLTASQRNNFFNSFNTLSWNVASMKRIYVPTSNTDLFDLNCERRRYAWAQALYINNILWDWTAALIQRQEWVTRKREAIKNSEKSVRYWFNWWYSSSSIWVVSKIQKKCQN